MKNIFKWHIRRVGDKYVVAKRGLRFWYYLDPKSQHAWSSVTESWRIHAVMKTIEEARNLRDSSKTEYIE